MSVLALLLVPLVQASQPAPPVTRSAQASSAVVFTPISADSSVAASIIGSLANYNETDSSADLEPNLQLQHSVASGNIAVNSVVSATNSPGATPPHLAVTTGFTAKMSGMTNNAAISYSYELTFELDQTSLVSLVNGNNTGSFPSALAGTSLSSASLHYTLRHQAGAEVFTYVAPTSNSAGTYAQAFVPAGTYEFLITGAASAPADPCCVLHSSSASGNVHLQFEAVPPLGPVSYCTAGTSASGCQASLTATGTPSATAASGFDLVASSVEGAKDGLFFFGTTGRQANSWGNGSSYQCVTPPVKRAGLLLGSGTVGLCDGSFLQDLNARWTARPPQNPGAGAIVQAQLWYRDPFNTSNQTTSLSNAIEFVVGP